MALEIDEINVTSLTVNGQTSNAVVMTSAESFPLTAVQSYLIAGHSFVSFGGANPDDDDAIWQMKIPSDWVSGGRLKIQFVTAAAGGANVKFLVNTNLSGVGGDMSAATQTGLFATTTGSATSWALVETTAITLSTTGFESGKALGFYVHRDGSDAADTYTGTAYINSITFEYNY